MVKLSNFDRKVTRICQVCRIFKVCHLEHASGLDRNVFLLFRKIIQIIIPWPSFFFHFRRKRAKLQRELLTMIKHPRHLVAAHHQDRRQSGSQENTKWRLWQDQADAEAQRKSRKRTTLSGSLILWNFSPGCCFR